MKIYIAATYARAPEAKVIARQLRERRHEITSESWHDQSETERRQEYEEWERDRWYDDEEKVSFEQYSAAEDVRGIHAADMVVCLSDQPGGFFRSTGGKHFEFGLALGLGGKYLILVGEPENVFHHARIIQRYLTWDDFFVALPAYEHAHLATYQLRKDALRGR